MHVDGVLRLKGTSVVSVAPTATLSDAAKLLRSHRIGALLVLDEDQMLGIISERDIVRSVAASGASALNTTVMASMSTDVVTCGPTDTLEYLMTLMTDRRIRHLPVVDQGKLIGVLSIGDVVKLRLSEISDEAQALSDYITTGR
jgi:CBS domain-containing protein